MAAAGIKYSAFLNVDIFRAKTTNIIFMLHLFNKTVNFNPDRHNLSADVHFGPLPIFHLKPLSADDRQRADVITQPQHNI